MELPAPTELQPQASTLGLLQEALDAGQPAVLPRPDADVASGLADGGTETAAAGDVMPSAGGTRPTSTAVEELLDDSMKLDEPAALPVDDSLGVGRYVAAVSHHQGARLWIILFPPLECRRLRTANKRLAQFDVAGADEPSKRCVLCNGWGRPDVRSHT